MMNAQYLPKKLIDSLSEGSTAFFMVVWWR